MDNFCFVKLLFVLALAFVFTCAASGQEDSLAYLRPSGSELRIEAAGYGITLGNRDAAVQKPASRKSGSPARVSTSFGVASLDIGFNILDNPACYGPWTGMDDFLDLSTGKSVRIGWVSKSQCDGNEKDGMYDISFCCSHGVLRTRCSPGPRHRQPV